MLVAFQHGGNIDVQLMDDNGQNRVSVVKDADELLNPNEWSSLTGNPAWSPDGTSVAVVWAVGQGPYRQVRLTWMRTDRSVRYETDGCLGIDDSFQNVEDMQWVGPCLFYRAERAGVVSIETTRLDNQRLKPLITSNIDSWYVVLSPDKQMTALILDEPARTVYVIRVDYLEWAHDLSPTMRVNPSEGLNVPPVWSPDSALLAVAYAQHSDAGASIVVDTITRDGLHVNHYRGVAARR